MARLLCCHAKDRYQALLMVSVCITSCGVVRSHDMAECSTRYYLLCNVCMHSVGHLPHRLQKQRGLNMFDMNSFFLGIVVGAAGMMVVLLIGIIIKGK
jgi:hypothetical protein